MIVGLAAIAAFMAAMIASAYVATTSIVKATVSGASGAWGQPAGAC